MRFGRLEMHLTPSSRKHGTARRRLIGHKPKGMTVVMSLSDLVDIVQVAAKGQSLGDALDAAGFQPVSGKKRITVSQGFPREPLVRRRFKGSGSE